MKILFAGNSQTSCLKRAFDNNPETLEKHQVYFHVTPGGTGPYFKIKDDKLSVIQGAINPNFPPRLHPEDVPTPSLNSFDVIIVSALGYIDGGFYYPGHSPVIAQGLLHQYSPKPNKLADRLLSKSCYKDIIFTLLSQQPGFQFLFDLKNNYNKRIIVQPFPFISEIIKNHQEWPINKMYNDPLGAHAFFQKTRSQYLMETCKKLSVELLPYPVTEWEKTLFAPKEFMALSDGLHPSDDYGQMIIEQIEKKIR
jgi:hypothetical protein